MSDSLDATPDAENRAAVQEPTVIVKDGARTVPDNTNADIEAGVSQEEASALSQNAPTSTTKRMVCIATALLAVVLCVVAGWYLQGKFASTDLTTADKEIQHSDNRGNNCNGVGMLNSNPADQESSSMLSGTNDTHCSTNQDDKSNGLKPILPSNEIDKTDDNEDLSKAKISDNQKRIMISKALKWKQEYIDSLADSSLFPKYSTKPFAITERVFTFIETADSNTSQLDNGFGVVEKTYGVYQLNSVDEVLGAFKSEFEFKHFYAYHSLFGGLSKNKDLSFNEFFTFYPFINNAMADCENEIIVKLFDCVNGDSEQLFDHEMVIAVMQSQFLDVLLTIFAKAAYLHDDILVVSHDSLKACFPMWFNGQQLNTTLDGVIAIVRYFLTVMVNAIHFSNEEVKQTLKGQPSLRLALHLTLIYMKYGFLNGKASSDTIKKNSSDYAHNGNAVEVTFGEFTQRLIDGIPVFPDSNVPLLLDAK